MKITCNLTDEVIYNYQDYLKSNHWKIIKKIKFNYFVHECAMCQSRVGLELHHKHYDSLGNEDLDDLVYLCRKCHQKTHDENKSLKNTYDRLKGYKIRKERQKKKTVKKKGKNSKVLYFEKQMKKNKIMYMKKDDNHYRCRNVDYWVSTKTFYDSKNKYKGKGLEKFIEYIK